MSTVLVTGGSGFIGSHIILQLLAAGHQVRTTVRSLEREPEVRTMLSRGGAEAGDRLTFFATDLLRDAGWMDAMEGCDQLLHVASPLPTDVPEHEDELIIPARDGARRVLYAAREAGVKRVVLTSSFAAVGYGHAPRDIPFDETSWTNTSAPGLTAYTKSKTLAERAAWDFIASEGAGLELAVVNPVAVFGPVLGPDFSASIELLRRMLDGGIPAYPRLSFGVVDVRDVADLHIRAMTHPAAKGERFLAVAGDFLAMRDIARILKDQSGPLARKVSTTQLPDWLVHVGARFNAQLRQTLPELGRAKNATSEKAERVLGWTHRSREECLVATAESLAALGILKSA